MADVNIPSTESPKSESHPKPLQTVRLYDRKTGIGKDFSPDEAHAAYLSGKFAPARGQVVPVTLGTGQIGTVPGESLHEVFDGGGTFSSPFEVRHAEREAQYGGLGGAAKAFGAGAARGLTFGLSDVAASTLGGDKTRESLEALKEVHPTISTVGEVAGVVAPSFFTGGGAAAARGAAGAAEAARVAEAAGLAAKGSELAKGAEVAAGGVDALRAAEAARAAEVAAPIVPSIARPTATTIAEAGGAAPVVPSLALSEGAAAAPSLPSMALREAGGGVSGIREAGNLAEGAAAISPPGIPRPPVSPVDTFGKGVPPINGGSYNQFLSPSPLTPPYVPPVVPGVPPIVPPIESVPAAAKVAGIATEAAGETAAVSPGIFKTALKYSPAHMVSTLETAVEQGIMSSLGVGPESALAARAAAKALSLGGRGAVGGALAGLGGQISEDALGDHKLNAEKIMAAIGHGALYGAATGAAIGVGGEFTSSALRRAGASVSTHLDRMANNRAFEALGGTKKITQYAEKSVDGGASAVGRRVRLEGILDGLPDDKTKLGRIDAALKKYGKAISDTVASTNTKISTKDAIAAFDEVISKVAGKADHEAIERALIDSKVSFFSKLGLVVKDKKTFRIISDGEIPFVDFVAQRRALGDMAYKESQKFNPSLTSAEKQAITGKLEELEMESLESAAKRLTGDEAKNYKSLKRAYQELKVARKAAQAGIGSRPPMQDFSPGYYAAHGIMFGHPIGGIALGAGKSLINTLAHNHGNTVAANILGRLADLTSVRAVVNQVDREMDAGVEAMLRNKPGPKSSRPSLRSISGSNSQQEEYEARVNHVQMAATEPQRAAAAIEPMLRQTPKTAGALAEVATRATTYLAGQIPITHKPTDSLTPQVNPRPPSQAVMAQFMRKASVTDDPLSVLDHMRNGTLTSDHVQALNQTSPLLADELRAKVTNGLVKRKNQLPMGKEVQIRLLFGLRSGLLDPKFVGAMQSTYHPAEEPRKGSSYTPAMKTPDLLTHAQKSLIKD